ncbi:hypothetical protein QJQ45_027395, partial [Haematococcus lacustris]
LRTHVCDPRHPQWRCSMAGSRPKRCQYCLNLFLMQICGQARATQAISAATTNRSADALYSPGLALGPGQVDHQAKQQPP